MSKKIVTVNIYPPIPVRTFDWTAYYDGDEEAGPAGYGATEEAAVRDLLEQVEAYDYGDCTCEPGAARPAEWCPEHGRDPDHALEDLRERQREP